MNSEYSYGIKQINHPTFISSCLVELGFIPQPSPRPSGKTCLIFKNEVVSRMILAWKLIDFKKFEKYSFEFWSFFDTPDFDLVKLACYGGWKRQQSSKFKELSILLLSSISCCVFAFVLNQKIKQVLRAWIYSWSELVFYQT